jgi:hypothetical protein
MIRVQLIPYLATHDACVFISYEYGNPPRLVRQTISDSLVFRSPAINVVRVPLASIKNKFAFFATERPRPCLVAKYFRAARFANCLYFFGIKTTRLAVFGTSPYFGCFANRTKVFFLNANSWDKNLFYRI